MCLVQRELQSKALPMLQTEEEELLEAAGEAKIEGKGAKMRRTKMNLVITRVVVEEVAVAEVGVSSEDIDLVT